MDRLRTAYLSVAVVLIPLTAAYTWHVVQHSDGLVGRGEAALRAVLSVGVVVWTVLWSAYILAQNQARRPIVARARVLQEATVQLPVVAQPAGLDPKVMELGRRIAGRLDRAPDMRQED